MTDLNEMWARLEEYQPIADKRGYGTEWAKMCRERTPRAAKWVAKAAAATDAAAWAADAARAAKWAAKAATDAAWAASAARNAERAAKTAMKCINQAEEVKP
jgi:hypothetical protein